MSTQIPPNHRMFRLRRLPSEVTGIPTATPVNTTRTDADDPLRGQITQGPLHWGSMRVMGTGWGPETKQRQGMGNQRTTVGLLCKWSSDLSFDPERHKLQDPRPEHSLIYKAGDKVIPALLRNPLTRLADTGPLGGAVVGAGLAGVTGLAGQAIYNRFFSKAKPNNQMPAWKTALWAALGGAGLGAYSGSLRHQFAKQGSAYGGSLMQNLQSAGLPFSVVSAIADALSRLSQSDMVQLRMAVGGLTGMALAYALAGRLGLGGITTLLSTVGGGMFGARSAGAIPAHRSDPVDYYGRPYRN